MPDKPSNEPEGRWPALIALLAVGGLYTALPASLAVGPTWLPLIIIVILSAGAVISREMKQHLANEVFSHLLAGAITLFLMVSLCLLVREMIRHGEPPTLLLRSAVALWVTNVLVFSFWYWRLDAGGPNIRHKRAEHTKGAFLFPQMTREGAEHDDADVWMPQFIDYLFLAFNTSTALSPTDAPVLSRWAKLLMMVQATISLAIIVLLAARAVNIM